jgi:ribosome-binding factor A
MSQRTARLGDLIRNELSELLRREIRDPRVSLATVSTVEVSADLSHATVKISALGDDAARLDSVRALVHARGFLRRELARRLDLRLTPELHFELDRGPEYSQRISDLLDSLHTTEPGTGGSGEEER